MAPRPGPGDTLGAKWVPTGPGRLFRGVDEDDDAAVEPGDIDVLQVRRPVDVFEEMLPPADGDGRARIMPPLAMDCREPRMSQQISVRRSLADPVSAIVQRPIW